MQNNKTKKTTSGTEECSIATVLIILFVYLIFAAQAFLVAVSGSHSRVAVCRLLIVVASLAVEGRSRFAAFNS